MLGAERTLKNERSRRIDVGDRRRVCADSAITDQLIERTRAGVGRGDRSIAHWCRAEGGRPVVRRHYDPTDSYNPAPLIDDVGQRRPRPRRPADRPTIGAITRVRTLDPEAVPTTAMPACRNRTTRRGDWRGNGTPPNTLQQSPDTAVASPVSQLSARR